MGHNVGKAAERAVERSNRIKPSERTPEQILSEIRNNLSARIWVTPDDQRFLLAEYDKVHALMVQGTEISISGAQALEQAYADIDALQEIDRLKEEAAQLRAELNATVENARQQYASLRMYIENEELRLASPDSTGQIISRAEWHKEIDYKNAEGQKAAL